MSEIRQPKTRDHRLSSRDRFLMWLMAIIALVLFGFAYAQWHQSASEIQNTTPVVKEIDFRYPTTLPGTLLSHAFIVKNNFDQVLYFDRLAVSCTCTTGKLEKNILQPGEQTTLTLATALPDFELTNYVKAGLFGHVDTRPIELRYVLTRESAYPLNFSDKSDYFSDNSDYFNFGTVAFGSAAKTYPPVIISRGDLPMDWDNITVNTDDSNLTAELVPLAPSGPQNQKKWKLQLAYQPRMDIGLVNSHLIFTFWKQGKPLDYRQVKGINIDVAGPVYATPSSLLIGAVTPNSITIIPVTIGRTDSNDAAPLKVIGVTYSDPKSVSAIWSMQDGNSVVNITYKALNAIGKQDTGQINVTVQGDQKYILRLSYMAMIMPPQTNATAQSN